MPGGGCWIARSPITQAEPRPADPSGAVAAVQDRPGRAVLLVVAAMICFSVMDGVSKHLTETLPAFEIIWIRYAALTVLVVPLVLRAGGRDLAGPGTGILALRGLCMLASGALFVAALSELPIAEATVIGFVSPFLVTVLSMAMLGEPVGWRRWAALATGFAGVLVIIRPGTAEFTPAALLPLASAAFWAVGLVLTRKLRIGPSDLTVLFWTAMGVVPGLLPALPVWRDPTLAEWAWGVVGGGLLLLGQALLIRGYRSGRATLLAPFSYTQILWASAIGLFAFGSAPEPSIWAGAALVVASGLYSLRADRPARP